MCKSSLAKDYVVKGDWSGVNDEFSNYTFQYVVARLSVTYHYTDKTCLFNRCCGCINRRNTRLISLMK